MESAMMLSGSGFVRVGGAELLVGARAALVDGGLLLSQANVVGIENCLGAVAMPAGAVSREAVKHETSEVMYVAAGCGELRTDEGAVVVAVGDAIFIPTDAWHWLANTGESDLVSVFTFPRPSRPVSYSRPMA